MSSTKDHSETIALLRGMVVETISQAALAWPKTLGIVYANQYIQRVIEARMDAMPMREIRNATALYADWPTE